ncbi:MAG: hypothetical protein R3B68_07970 [Phycisphaerales bacterium]
MSAIQPSSKPPIGEGPEPAPAPEFHAPPKRRVPAPYIAGAIVVSVSAATLFAMRKYGMGEGIRFEHTDVRSVGADVPRVDAAKYGLVMERLSSSNTPMQVPSDVIDKDPFFFERDRAVVEHTDNSAEQERLARDRAERERLARERREQDLRVAYARLRLNTVIDGRVPVANINGQIVGVGDRVDDIFEIVSISNGVVTLKADELTFTLQMQQMITPGGNRPRGGGMPSSSSSGSRPRN